MSRSVVSSSLATGTVATSISRRKCGRWLGGPWFTSSCTTGCESGRISNVTPPCPCPCPRPCVARSSKSRCSFATRVSTLSSGWPLKTRIEIFWLNFGVVIAAPSPLLLVCCWPRAFSPSSLLPCPFPPLPPPPLLCPLSCVGSPSTRLPVLIWCRSPMNRVEGAPPRALISIRLIQGVIYLSVSL